jgi:hypothetical protein
MAYLQFLKIGTDPSKPTKKQKNTWYIGDSSSKENTNKHVSGQWIETQYIGLKALKQIISWGNHSLKKGNE